MDQGHLDSPVETGKFLLIGAGGNTIQNCMIPAHPMLFCSLAHIPAIKFRIRRSGKL
jgi:hypothetical protein